MEADLCAHPRTGSIGGSRPPPWWWDRRVDCRPPDEAASHQSCREWRGGGSIEGSNRNRPRLVALARTPAEDQRAPSVK